MSTPGRREDFTGKVHWSGVLENRVPSAEPKDITQVGKAARQGKRPSGGYQALEEGPWGAELS